MTTGPVAGYYADPSIPGYIRYWDGTRWVAGTSRPAPSKPAAEGAEGQSGQGSPSPSPAPSPSQATDVWKPGPTGSDPSASGPSPTSSQSTPRPMYPASNQVPAQERAQTPHSPRPQSQPPQSQPRNPIESPSQAHARAQVQAQAQALSPTPILPIDPLDPRAVPAAREQRAAERAARMKGQWSQPLRPAVDEPLRTIVSGTRRGAPPAPAPAPAPSVARPAYSEPGPEAESGDAGPYSVSTMLVPSAFVNAGAYSQGWGGPNQAAGSPFAGLPGFGAGPRTAPEEQPAPQVKVVLLASPGSRLLAKIIDLFVALLMSSPATVTLLLVAHRHDHQYVEGLRLKATSTYTTLGMDGTGIALWALAATILIMVAMLYEAFRVGAGGQTTGRRLVGIRVVRAGTGDRFRTGSALVRGVLFWVLLLVPVVDVLALGPVAWGRPYRQGLHDKITRAVTVRTD